MIYEISKEVAADLRSRRVPFPVVYGPEVAEGLPQRERIIIQRTSDQIIATPGGGGRNSTESPKTASIAVNQGVLIRIFARAPMANAGVQDHQRRAEHARDRVIGSFERVVRDRKNRIVWNRAEHVKPEDVAPEQTAPWVGAVYELECFIDRSIADRAWPTPEDPQGAALDEVVIGTDVELATPAPPEIL